MPPDEQLASAVQAPDAVAQVGVPEVVATPSIQLNVLLPVVGAVLSVELPVAPWLIATALGAVQVLLETVHVVPAATEQLLGARVVTLQLSVTPPTFTVALIAVENDALDVSRTAKVWPLLMLPDVTQLPPLMLMVAPVPVTETGVDVLMPLIEIAAAVVRVLGFAPVTSAKVKALGVVSHAVCCVQAPVL